MVKKLVQILNCPDKVVCFLEGDDVITRYEMDVVIGLSNDGEIDYYYCDYEGLWEAASGCSNFIAVVPSYLSLETIRTRYQQQIDRIKTNAQTP